MSDKDSKVGHACTAGGLASEETARLTTRLIGWLQFMTYELTAQKKHMRKRVRLALLPTLIDNLADCLTSSLTD